MINTTTKSAGSPTSGFPSRGLDNSRQNNSSGLFHSTKIFEIMPTKGEMIEKLLGQEDIIGSKQEDAIWEDYFRVLTESIKSKPAEVNNQQSAKLLDEINNGIEIAFSVINHVYGLSKEHPRALAGLYYFGMIHHLGQRLQTEQRVQWLAELIAKWPQIIIGNLGHIVRYYDSACFKCKGDSCTESLSFENTLRNAQSLFVGDAAAVHVVPIAKTLLTIIYLSKSTSLKNMLGAELKKVIHDDSACNAIEQSVKEYRQSLLPSPTPSRFNLFSSFHHQPVASAAVVQPVIQEQPATDERNQFTETPSKDSLSEIGHKLADFKLNGWSINKAEIKKRPSGLAVKQPIKITAKSGVFSLALSCDEAEQMNTELEENFDFNRRVTSFFVVKDQNSYQTEVNGWRNLFHNMEFKIQLNINESDETVRDIVKTSMKVVLAVALQLEKSDRFRTGRGDLFVLGLTTKLLVLGKPEQKFSILYEFYNDHGYDRVLYYLSQKQFMGNNIMASLREFFKKILAPFSNEKTLEDDVKELALTSLAIVIIANESNHHNFIWIPRFLDALAGIAGINADSFKTIIQVLLNRQSQTVGGTAGASVSQPATASSVQEYSSTEPSAVKMNRQSQTVGGTAGASVSQSDTPSSVKEYSSTVPLLAPFSEPIPELIPEPSTKKDAKWFKTSEFKWSTVELDKATIYDEL